MDEATRPYVEKMAASPNNDLAIQATIALELADLVAEVRALREAIRNGAIVSHVIDAPIVGDMGPSHVTNDVHTTMIAPDLSRVRLTAQEGSS